MEVVELRKVVRLAVEDLHAVVLAIGHVDQTLAVGRDVVRQVETAGIGPGLAPGKEMAALGIVLVHARVAVTVGDVDVAGLGTERDVRGPVERLAALERRRLVGIADREQQLAVRSELPDRVVQIVGQPVRPVRPDGDAVRAPDHPLAPRPQERALPVEDDHRMLPPVEHDHVVLGVDGNAGGLHVRPPFRQPAPADDGTIVHIDSPWRDRGVADGYTAGHILPQPR